MIRRRFVVQGRVQGVGFRSFAERQAIALGLHGSVQNQPDGSVLCIAEGPAAAVEALGERLRRGPSFARVTAVVVDDLPPTGQQGFSIEP